MIRTTIVIFLFVFSLTVQAAIYRVPDDFAEIQAAMNAASDGDIILVSPGQYDENVNFLGKDVTLTSLDPNDPTIVSSTIISRPITRDARSHVSSTTGNGSIVSFVSGESAAAVLTGFTITGGYGTNLDGNYYYGAGILCVNSSPTITHNLITENLGPTSFLEPNPIGYGGGICCIGTEAYVAYNLFTDNSGSAGGGMLAVDDDSLFYCNVVIGNTGYIGGGAALVGAHLINNTFVGNRIAGSGSIGGNLYTVAQSGITPQIANNIIFAAPQGFGVIIESDNSNLSWFHHNNVYGNQPGNYIDLTTGQASNGPTGQNGNLSVDPLFVSISDNDFHLKDDSPCVDAGDPMFDTGIGALDIDGHWRLFGQTVDLGAYENTRCTAPIANAGPDQTTTVGQEVTLNGTASIFCDPNTMQRFLWDQSEGPSVRLSDPLIGTPTFTPQQQGTYRFELMLFDGTDFSRPDLVTVIVKTEPLH